MRIGLVYPEYSRHRGIERISAALADCLAARGHEVHFHCGRREADLRTPVHFHRVPTVNVTRSSRLLSFALLGRAGLAGRHYDITHSYGNVVGCDVVTAQSCHRASLEALGACPGGRIQAYRNLGWVDRIYLGLEIRNFGRRKYRRVIACSGRVKNEVTQYYQVPPDDITVISNGVDTELFRPVRDPGERLALRHEIGFTSEDFVLLFAGHEFTRKGLETVIRSLPLIRDPRVRLAVCGGDMIEPFADLARRLGVEERVHFAGVQKEIQRFFQAADVFVLPSVYEAFGLVIIEAMACGLPVVVSKSAGAAEDIITDKLDGVLLEDPCSAPALAEKLSWLMREPGLRREIGARAHARVQALGWENYTERVLEVYELVARTKHA